jgi:hypothetical protein
MVDVHQVSVAIGQSAVAATDIHNSLPPNYRCSVPTRGGTIDFQSG